MYCQCLGYLRRNLIDFRIALNLAVFSVPFSIYSSYNLHLPETLLKACYTVLMLGIGSYLLYTSTSQTNQLSVSLENHTVVNNLENISTIIVSTGNKDSNFEDISTVMDSTGNEVNNLDDICTIMDSTGNIYTYNKPTFTLFNQLTVSLGGLLCGLLGVGIGEVLLPQLLAKQIPVAVAAASSTLVVMLTCLSCAGVQITSLIQAGGISAIPWNLVIYMIPGVVIGKFLEVDVHLFIPSLMCFDIRSSNSDDFTRSY